jgi:hypothetical protein
MLERLIFITLVVSTVLIVAVLAVVLIEQRYTVVPRAVASSSAR